MARVTALPALAPVLGSPARRRVTLIVLLLALVAAAFGAGKLLTGGPAAPGAQAISPPSSGHADVDDRYTVHFTGKPIVAGRNTITFQIEGLNSADRRRAARYAPSTGATALVRIQRVGAEAGPVSVPAHGSGDTWRAELTVPDTGAWWVRVVVRAPASSPTTFDVPLWIPGTPAEEAP